MPATAADLAHVVQSLADSERLALWLKALIGPATGKTVFLDCLNKASADLLLPLWSNKTLTPLLNSFGARGLLDENLACRSAIAHPLTVQALADSAGGAMLRAIRQCLPADGGGQFYYDYKIIEAATTRWMRLAVYLNDEAAFNRLAELRAQTRGGSVIESTFAATTVGVDWLASRQPGFQRTILSAKVSRLLATGQPAPDHDALLAHYRTASRQDPALASFVGLVADCDIFASRLGGIAETIAAPPAEAPAEMVCLIAALHALLSDDVSLAVARFAETVRLIRKATRKRKIQLPGYQGLLHAAALIAADDASLHPEIEAALTVDYPHVGHVALRALFEMALNRQTAARQLVNLAVDSLRLSSVLPPFDTGLLAVAALVVDPALARKNMDSFASLFRKVETALPLVADMLAEVLEKIAINPAPYRDYLARPEREVRFRFANLITAKPAWERSLESIEAMLNPAKPASPAATAKTKRLIWQLDAATGEVQPLEQSAQARGWTAGRPVALKRLHQNDSRLDYLDDPDRRVVRTIRRFNEGYYNAETYDFVPESTLPALVGHPRLFDMTAPAQPIELIEGRAELVLSSEKQGFRLMLSHAADEPTAFVEIEAPGRWRMVRVDAKAVGAAAVLGDKGLWVPALARDRLVALARLDMPALPLRIETAELDDGVMEDGDANTVMRLQPLGAGVKIALVVRPFGETGPHFLPGMGGRIVLAQIDGRPTRRRRHLDQEKTKARALAEACASLGGEGPEWILEDQLSVLELLAELQALPQPPALEWPEGQKLALRGEAKVSRLKASIKGTDSWFTLGGTVAIDEDLVLDLKDLLERLDHAQGRFIPLPDGGFVALDRHFRAQLDRLKLLGDGLKIPALAGVAVRGLLEQAGSVKADARWTAFTHRLDEAEAWQPSLPAGFEAELRDYQFEGFAWMARLARWGAGACLADDMGLGKTVQAIGVMLSLASEGPCLVVAPTSVCGNWEMELARFAPSLRTTRLAESGDRGETLGKLGAGDVLLASYGLLGREEERLTGISWSVVVLDEAQAIKNPETQRAKASQKLQAGFRLALTGTPVENDLTELWSLFRFVSPGLLGSREAFGRRFATPIERDNDPGAKAALRALVRPFLLRRTKAAVLAELPARTEQTMLVEMGEEERAFYEALRRRAMDRLTDAGAERTRMHILAEIGKLRQACCHPTLVAPDADVPAAKLEALLELVEELRLNRHRALVFSQFVGHLGKVRAALDERGVTYQYLDGATPAREREKRVAAFQAGEGELFLISLKAGGFGLNLTAADYVIHLDPWWNPAVEDQASDRAHRIGQMRPVTIYRLIVKDSIEEGILALHRRKRDLADALLEGADASARLTEEDLIDLIRQSAAA